MAKYQRIVTTEAGLKLLASAVAGGTITFTAIKTGSGTYTGTENLSTVSDLKSVRQTFGVSSITRTGTQVKLRSVLNNDNLTEGYSMTEIGLYAKDPDTGANFLYAIIVAELADYLPPYELAPASITLELYLELTEAESGVTFAAEVVAGTYVPVENFNEHVSSEVHITPAERTAWNKNTTDISNITNGTTAVGNATKLNGQAATYYATQKEVDDVKKSVSDGKALVAGAITEKGVNTATDATFATMADNIGAIEVGIDTSDATATADTIMAGRTAGVKGSIITGTMADFLGKNLGYQPSGETYVDDGTPVTRLYLSSYVAMKKASNSLPLLRIKLGTSGAVNENTYVDVPVTNLSEGNIKAGVMVGYPSGNIGVTGTFTADGTAAAAHIMAGKIAYVNGSKVTGVMVDNGAVAKTLGINDSYTIPAGYHNGAGKVTQNIATKGAETFTPGDVAQAIASGQYLTGAQTISAVPTETKTVTAGTAATTVNRTSGKYMTAVTVNPTPSQSKSVTLTSSPLTITPDAGYLLSAVTVSAELGKKFASGTLSGVERGQAKYLPVYGPANGYQNTSEAVRYISIDCGFVPTFVMFVTRTNTTTGDSYSSGFVTTQFTTRGGYSYNGVINGNGPSTCAYQTTVSGNTVELGYLLSIDVTTVDITWYAFG